ncbi:MAG: PAS domain S-box protein [Balneolaceae bacterium]|nr:PAS domain S-box protein [Balneolaceae bacterium]
MIKDTKGFFNSQAMFICDQLSLKILDSNEAACQLLNKSELEFAELTLHDLVEEVTPDLANRIQQNSQASTYDKVWKIKSFGSTDRLVQFSSHIITYKGKPAKILVAHDVTELVEELEEPLISTPVGFQGFPLAEVEWKPTGEILRWSDKATEMLGWEEVEVVGNGTSIKDFVHDEDKELVFGSIQQMIDQKGEDISISNRVFTKDGKMVYSEWHNSILYDTDGEVISVYSLIANVTERALAFKESQKSIQSYQDLFDSMTDAIYILDDDNKIVIANKGIKLTYGYKLRDLVGKDQSILRAPGKFDEQAMTEIRERSKTQKAQKLEVWSRKANGEVFLTEMLVNRGSYFGKNVLIIIERDISDRKFAEEELIRRETLFSELFNTSPLAITLLNTHNEVELVNKGFEQLFGYQFDEIKGLEIDKIIVPEYGIEEATRLTNSPIVEEKQLVRIAKNGDRLNVIVYSVPVMIEGNIQAKFGLYVDITERKQAEETIKKSLKEKEVLLAEVHHRVKNNLAVITGLLELQSYASDNYHAQKVLKDSQMRVKSIALVHEKLYQNDNLSEVNVSSYMEELITSVKRAIGSRDDHISIEMDIDNLTLPVTQAIPCGLLVNEIVTNSYKHAFKGLDEGLIEVSLKTKGEFVQITVQDNGVGFDQENYTKPGLSLGMKLIRTLSKQLRASTEVRSKDGTSYSIEFKITGSG